MYIGKVDNSEQGRNLFKKEVLQYFETMQNINAIQNFDPDSDVIVEQGDELDQVICDCYIQPVDSMEKLYSSRFTSRILGDFKIMIITGGDLRKQMFEKR